MDYAKRDAARMELRRARGFTLVELMIVLMVIVLIVAIATVGAISTRVNTNEGLAKSSLKSVSSACEGYHVANGMYPNSLTTLGSNYLDPALVSGQKSGYAFEIKSGAQGTSFTCTAVPQSANYTGVKSFCIDASNLVRIYGNSTITGDGSACPAGGTPVT